MRCGEGDVRKDIFKVFGEAAGVALCREQAEDGIKNIFRRDRKAISLAKAGNQDGRNIGGISAYATVIERESIAAVAAPERVAIWIF